MWKFLCVFMLAVVASNGEYLYKKKPVAPYQVSVIKYDSIMKSRRFYCGGTIISKNWFITAAHCRIRPFDDLYVRAGSNFQHRDGSVHTINKTIPLDNYSEISIDVMFDFPLNDLALVKVNEPFVFDDTRKPIDLFGENDQIPEGYNATIVGWRSNMGSEFYLDTFNIRVLPRTKCNEMYRRVGGIKEFHVCTGLDGRCIYYIGGPLIVNGRLAAIASWTNRCTLLGDFDVFVKISDYRGWIRSITGV